MKALFQSREFYVPAHAIKVSAKDSKSVVYIHERNPEGLPAVFLAVGFAGKAIKPTFNYRFSSDKKRAQYVAAWFARQAEHAQYKQGKQNEKRETLSKPHLLKLGDILRASWGYDQTNIDYFQVTALIGKRMVEIRKIGAEVTDTGWAQGNCVPSKDHFIGEAMRKSVSTYDNKSVRIYSFAHAYLMEPIRVDGIAVGYASSSFSSTH